MKITNFKLTNRILAGFTLIFSFVIYVLTMAKTVSYWDCGEFIATSYILGVPHPPGSPLYLIIGRIFSMIPFPGDIALRVNMISPIVSALAVMLLYLIIVKVIEHWKGKVSNLSDAVFAFGSALIGSLVFAFSDSHWFNAVEAEVYAFSTFLTALVVWIVLLWQEEADKPGHLRYIIIIAYIIGLATGIHLLNLLTLPFVALIFYFRKMEFEWKTFGILMGITAVVFFVIHNGIVKGIPNLASVIGVSGIGVVFAGAMALTVWSILKKHKLLNVIMVSMVLVMIGYSSYITIFIRSGQNPEIDENDPETITAAIHYLERKQYGEIGQFPRRYTGLPPAYEVVGPPQDGNEYSSAQNRDYMFYNFGKQWNFFLSYQLKKMYWRYFLWQFAGRGPSTDKFVTAMGADSREDGVDWFQYGIPLALILGIMGIVFQFNRDQKMAFSVLTLFIMTGLAIILYLNQDDPQPRERDYSYVGSFLAFSIWVGIGAGAILDKLQKFIKSHDVAQKVSVATILVLLTASPGVMLVANYFEHDRTGNYVAWDYSYNLLQSCEPDGIIFTNGDNDTFPLWYLQTVEGIRKDVAVVNLALLNTDWYIRQARDSRPPEKRFISMSDQKINQIANNVTPWRSQTVRIPVDNDSLNLDRAIEWTLNPTYAERFLKVQDLMILRIMMDNNWRFPIYFAVTVSPQNRLGLDKYINMEGLVFRLQSHETDFINPEAMHRNLMNDVGTNSWITDFDRQELKLVDEKEVNSWSREYKPGYLYRNLGNKDVYYNPQTMRLLQNYRSGYQQLALYYLLKGKESGTGDYKGKVLAVLENMEENIPEETIPIHSKQIYFQLSQIYAEAGNKKRAVEIVRSLTQFEDANISDKARYAQALLIMRSGYEDAIEIYTDLLDIYRGAAQPGTQRRFRSGSRLSQADMNFLKTRYSDIVFGLYTAYKETGQYENAEALINEHLADNQEDEMAKNLLKELSGLKNR